MRALAFAALLALAAGSTFAQTPPQTQTPPPAQKPPAQQPPAQQPPAQQPPAQQPPAQQPPAQPGAQPTAPQPPVPFPEGAKVGYVDLQWVAQQSTEGKSASAKINDLNQKKTAELAEKNKQLQAAQQKLAQSGTVLNDSARAQLEKEIDRMQREIQFLQQNAQAEIQDLTTELQQDFQRRLFPVIQQIGNEKGLHLILSFRDSGIIWGHQGLDLSPEIVKRFDAHAKPTAAPIKK
jgi:Skp family chaperone for outer membrane proteins